MMPWDILVTVDGYWEYKFRNQSVDYVDTSEQELTKYCNSICTHNIMRFYTEYFQRAKGI